MIYAKCIKNIDPMSNKILPLKISRMYEVECIDMGQSYTWITLKELAGSYNSILFEFYENDKSIDIYSDKRFNPYL